MMPLLISYFTADWKYPQHAYELRQQCDALGLDHHIEERPSAGGYIQNCCIKPQFILDCLERFQRPVLWVDVDASIEQRPVFFDGLDCDFAAMRMNPAHRKRWWHVGTMYWAPTPSALEFVREWVSRTGDMTDESSLDQTFKSREWPLRCVNVPPEYFVIQQQHQKPPAGSVIVHRISSGPSKKQQTEAFNRYEREVG